MTHSNGIQIRAGIKKPSLPVDRGWAWLIMLAAYVILLLSWTFGRSLSILLPSILDRYQAPATVTTLAFGIGDIAWSVINLVIPTVLLPRFSVRSLALVGSVLHCLGIIALAYAPNIVLFNCVFGVLGSAGGLMIVPSLIHLGHFFKKRLSFASAFAHAGGSTSAVFVPLLTQKLLGIYGLHGTLLIVAGMCFNCVVASMLLRPLSMYDHVEDVKEPIGHDPIDLEFSALNNIQNQNGSLTYDDCDVDEVNEKSKFLEDVNNKSKRLEVISLPLEHKITGTTYVDNDNVLDHAMDDAEEITEFIHKFQPELPHSDQHENDDNELKDEVLQNEASDNAANHHTSSVGIYKRVLYSSDSAVSNYNINSCENDTFLEASDCVQTPCSYFPSQKRKSTPVIYPELLSEEKHKLSTTQDNFNQSYPVKSKESNIENNAPTIICFSIRKMKDYILSSALSNPVAVMLILACGVSTPGGAMYFPVLGLENGLIPEEVPWMITIIGVADVVGKLAIGYFADMGYLRPIRIVCMTQFIVGTMCQFTMFYKGFAAMATMATIFGLTAGIVQALLTPMIIEMVGLQYLAQITPFYFLANGVATFILNVSVGAIRDATSSFTGGFSFLGVMMLLSFLLLLLEPVFVRCRDRKRSK